MEIPNPHIIFAVSSTIKLIEMKTVTRYEVRSNTGYVLHGTDNYFNAVDVWSTACESTMFTFTIHEITTTERDITDNARITPDVMKQSLTNNIQDELNKL